MHKINENIGKIRNLNFADDYATAMLGLCFSASNSAFAAL